MSNKVQEFLSKIEEDPALQTQLAKALESDNDREAVTALAKSKGYEFSSDELWSEIQKRQAEFSTREAAGELSDTELEAVAGGKGGGGAVSITVQLTIQVGTAIIPTIKW
ncbi:MAG: Nif11-like leader peptide family natural product precursor [Nostoc sp.]|uniref:Nif11-like leader peptide family natural product precursor n=1 Tax=Nostoc sp. TaxID=1180 RepID=UPI002FFB2496